MLRYFGKELSANISKNIGSWIITVILLIVILGFYNNNVKLNNSIDFLCVYSGGDGVFYDSKSEKIISQGNVYESYDVYYKAVLDLTPEKLKKNLKKSTDELNDNVMPDTNTLEGRFAMYKMGFENRAYDICGYNPKDN